MGGQTIRTRTMTDPQKELITALQLAVDQCPFDVLHDNKVTAATLRSMYEQGVEGLVGWRADSPAPLIDDNDPALKTFVERLKALRSDAGFPNPVSLTFALTCPPSCPHPRRLPALRRSLRRWREPGSSPSSSVAPRRCAPSCWPAPPRRASSACAPASRPARGPSSRRAEPPSGPQSSRL